MKNLGKHVWRALAIGGGMIALAACAAPGYYDEGYGYGGYDGYDGYGTGYDYGGYGDGCYGAYTSAYCGYPVFSGDVFIGGSRYRGLHYRDGRGGRQYWHRGGWHGADGGRGGHVGIGGGGRGVGRGGGGRGGVGHGGIGHGGGGRGAGGGGRGAGSAFHKG